MVWMITLALGGRLSHELAACMSYTEQALAERAACESNPPTTQYEGQTFTLPCPPLWPGADSAAVCSTAYREPGCRAAWFSADLDATTVVRACARDYCAVLPGKKPAACADPDLAEALDLPALDVAILRFEGLSRRDAEVIAQRLEPSLNQEYKEVVDSEDGVDAGGETGVDDVAAACGEAPGELGFDWVRIPGGRYPVGQHPTGERAPAALAPSFAEVESFELMNVEVPVHQHDACVELGACDARPEEPDCHAGATFPANCLSYRDAEALCRFLGGRLPTDIEWEVAARGAEGRTYPWGDAWFDGAFEHEDRKVGSCPVTDTPEGLHDMGGNVREWTSTATSDFTHVTRSMMCAELSCLAYNRFPGELDAARHAYLGVRCARDLGATSQAVEAGGPGSLSAEFVQVHWSVLGDGVHVDGAQQRAVCSVEATIDPDGSTRAGGVVPNPDGTMCPYALHDAAVAAVGRSEWPPLDQPARTVLPVFFVPTP